MTKKKKSPDRAGHNINVIVDDEMHAALEKAVENKYKEKLSVVVRTYIRNGLTADGLL